MTTTDIDKMNDIDFIRESNRIEGIVREPTQAEIDEFHRFMALPEIHVVDLERFVETYQTGTRLRNKPGMDVGVGGHKPIPGGKKVTQQLNFILAGSLDEHDSYNVHHRYETLHPFMDCNGRSGRMLWAWQVRDLRLGFLHRYYYQSLSEHPARRHWGGEQ